MLRLGIIVVRTSAPPFLSGAVLYQESAILRPDALLLHPIGNLCSLQPWVFSIFLASLLTDTWFYHSTTLIVDLHQHLCRASSITTSFHLEYAMGHVRNCKIGYWKHTIHREDRKTQVQYVIWFISFVLLVRWYSQSGDIEKPAAVTICDLSEFFCSWK